MAPGVNWAPHFSTLPTSLRRALLYHSLGANIGAKGPTLKATDGMERERIARKRRDLLGEAERQLAFALEPHQHPLQQFEADKPPSSLADLGVTVSEEHAATLRAWRDMSCSSIGTESNTVFMDATCIETARILIDGQHDVIGPLSILDLSTFVTAYCLFDRIAFLHNPMFAPAELRKTFSDDVFNEIPVDTAGQADEDRAGIDVRAALYDVYLHTVLPRQEMLFSNDAPGLANAMRNSWRTLLGADPGNPNRPLHDQSPFSAMGSRRANTPDLDELSHDLTKDKWGTQDSLDGFSFDPEDWRENQMHVPVAESNGRSIFNLTISEMLRLPYSCSAGRLPYRLYLYQEAKRRGAVAERIARSSPEAVRFIEQNYNSVLGSGDTTVRLNLPPFLAAVLARISNPNEIPEAMSDLRHKAKPFRKNLEGLNACVKSGIRDDGGKRGTNVMLKALQDDARLLRQNAFGSAALKGAVAVAASAAIAAHTLPNSAAPWEAILFQASAGGFNALAALVDREFLDKLGRRLFRQEYWFLTRLGSSLRAATGGWDRLQKIWKIDGDNEEWFQRRFEEISKLRYV
jgi:hypothetical protein